MIAVSVPVDLCDRSHCSLDEKLRVFMYNIIYCDFSNKLLTKPACVILIRNMSELCNLSSMSSLLKLLFNY